MERGVADRWPHKEKCGRFGLDVRVITSIESRLVPAQPPPPHLPWVTTGNNYCKDSYQIDRSQDPPKKLHPHFSEGSLRLMGCEFGLHTTLQTQLEVATRNGTSQVRALNAGQVSRGPWRELGIIAGGWLRVFRQTTAGR